VSKNNEKGLTAAQFARIHNINKSTLLYYDEIGLFSPAYKADNGYRYYTYRQSQVLEMILTLRELNMSIEEIKAYMNEPSADGLIGIFNDKIEEVNVSIRRLKEIKGLLVSRTRTLKAMKQLDFSQIQQVDYPEEYLFVSRVWDIDSAEGEARTVIEHARKYHTHRMFNHSFGTMMGQDSLLNHRFNEYEGFFTKIDRPIDSDALFIKPAGTYVRAYNVGDWDSIPGTYERILAYAGKYGLTFSGYAFEEGLNEMAIKNMDEYVTQITIRIDS